jgi:hypothetical protein
MSQLILEAPEEVFDNRTLYDKLKEQHEIKKAEYEEQFNPSKNYQTFCECDL